MAAQHTPGPWSIILRPSPGLYCLLDERTTMPIDERAANARLMEAAPDMLAALRGLLACADPQRDRAEIRAARAVLATVEGNR